MFAPLTTVFFWQQATVLILPLLVGGVLHMAIVRFDLLTILKIPLNLNAFGANKTWRGLVVMPLLTVPGVWMAQQVDRTWATGSLEDQSVWLLGLALGIGYVLPELPNSYMKRRMGIRPGETSSRFPFLFSFIDQTDSALGCILVYAIWGIGDLTLWFVLFFFSAIVKIIVNFILWACGLRRQPL